MLRFVDIDSCLQTVKLIGAAGEMAPFPFIKGVALCAIVILENIQVCSSDDSCFVSFANNLCRKQKTIEVICESWPRVSSTPWLL